MSRVRSRWGPDLCSHGSEQGAGPVLALPWALPIGFTLDFISCAVVGRFTGGNSCQASVVDHRVSQINSLPAVTFFG